MARSFGNRRIGSLMVRLGGWLLIGGLALAGTGAASAGMGAAGERADSCAAAPGCAGRPAPGHLPEFVIIDTGEPDGRMAMASRPGHDAVVEIEAADDFIVSNTVRIKHVSFIGLLSGLATVASIQDVEVEIYRVFPLDSINPPSGHVPTRVNSPSDVDFLARAASANELQFSASVLNPSFLAANSVLNGIHPKPGQTTGGDGAVPGKEVSFDMTLTDTITLAPGHYFFIPKVQLSTGQFYWLSTAGPVQFTGDLQAWIRNASLDPDWLRVGTDIVGGGTPPKFDASFLLTGVLLQYLPLIQR